MGTGRKLWGLISYSMVTATILVEAWPTVPMANNEGGLSAIGGDPSKTLAYPIPYSELTPPAGRFKLDGSEQAGSIFIAPMPTMDQQKMYLNPSVQYSNPLGLNPPPVSINSNFNGMSNDASYVRPFSGNSNFNGMSNDASYARPFSGQMPMDQQYPPMMPPPRPYFPSSDWGDTQGPPPPPPPQPSRWPSSSFPGQWGSAGVPPPPPPRLYQSFGDGMFSGPRVTGRWDSRPELAPPMSSFDYAMPHSQIEYSPRTAPNRSLAVITVQYNVTSAFMPWGWEVLDVAASDAAFYPSSSAKAAEIGAFTNGIPPPPGDTANDVSMSKLPWWPVKSGSENDENADPDSQKNENMGAGPLSSRLVAKRPPAPEQGN